MGPEASLYLEAPRWMAAPDLCEGLQKLAASEDRTSVALWEGQGLREAIPASTVRRPAQLRVWVTCAREVVLVSLG